ncbi:MAG TPA: serine/threonine-protein kinase [Terriglobales bacterium]|nr:serine/threonine-protein kinase [Terriglobales bacterium]
MSSTGIANFGRYEILAEIGRGAMGVVYKARDPKIDRLVAIKAISLFGQEPEDEAEYRERFFIEARAAGRLSHPAIVTIFDVGEELVSHEPYIVMEYVAGQTLNRVLSGQNKKLPLGPALQIAQELAEALNYAHSQGVIHRDVKPANIMVTVEGHAKIADFGIAKLNQAHMTLPGQVLGTPAYMAPEQLSGEASDARSDIFSLGVILYNMITGFKPFQGNSATTVCFKVVNREPLAASSLNSDLPAQIDRIVDRAMAKDPAQRYQTGAEMARDIQALRKADKTLEETTTFFKRAVQEQIGFTNLRDTGIPAQKLPPPSAKGTFSAKRAGVANGMAIALSAIDLPSLPKKFIYSAAGILLASAGLLTYETVHARSTRPAESPASTATSNSSIAKNASKSIEEMVNRAATPDTGDVVSHSADVAHSAANEVPLPKANLHGSRPTGSGPSGKASSLKSVAATGESPIGSAHLRIHFEHPFASAQLSLWMDNALIYNQTLAAEPRKHGLFHHAEQLDLEPMVMIAGEHKLHVRVQSAGDAYDQSRTVTNKFTAGGETGMQIICNKHNNDLQVTIK